MGLKRLKGKNDVVGRNRSAVVPARLRPQAEASRREIRWIIHRFGDQAVFGRDFVKRGHQQRFVSKIYSSGQISLPSRYDRVEIIEGSERALPRGPQLGRPRIDVVEMCKLCRIFELSKQRDSVLPSPSVWP